MENKAFTERCITRLQSIGPTDPMLPVLTEYLLKRGRLFIGPKDMVWVIPTTGPAQIVTAVLDI